MSLRGLFTWAFFFIGASAHVHGADQATVLVVANESMPFNGVVIEESDGKRRVTNRGMTYEILEAAKAYGAPNFEYQFGLPWRRAQITTQQATEIPTAIVPFTRTPQRESQYVWIAELFSYQPRLSVYNQQPPSLEEAKDWQVAIIRGSAHIPYLVDLGFSNLIETDSALLNAKMVKSRRYDALYESEFVDTFLWSEAGYETEDLSFVDIGEEKQIYIAANLSFPADLAKQIHDAIKAMRADGSLQVILDRWGE